MTLLCVLSWEAFMTAYEPLCTVSLFINIDLKYCAKNSQCNVAFKPKLILIIACFG